MWQVNRQDDPAHPMRLFRHRPFRLDAQPLGRDLMAVAVATHKIPHTTGERADEEFNGTHAGTLAPVLYRLISHHSVSPAGNVIASPTMVCGGEFHCGLS